MAMPPLLDAFSRLWIAWMAALMVLLLVRTGFLPAHAQPIQPYDENPRYWQYEGEPVMPLGGSKDDNLFQIPNLEAHLDEMEAVGANYIRNTMSARDEEDGNVRPFATNEDGQYDLTELNPEYWDRFESMLEMTAEREILVQIELWDQWDHNEGRWAVSPWNPDNNVNYEASEVSLEGPESYENVTAGSEETHDLFMTVPAVRNDETVLPNQQRFVDGGSVTLDLTGADGPYEIEWLNVEASEWTAERTVEAGQEVRLEAPGDGNWGAIVERE